MTTAKTEQDFPVEWDDPADAETCWRSDPEHLPGAVRPLEFDLGLKRFLEGFGWGMEPRQFNYFVFFAFHPRAGDGSVEPPTPDSVRESARRWREEVLPEVIELTEHYRTTDFEAMTNEQLALEIERLPELRFRSGQLHTLAIQPHWEGSRLLIDAYRELAGGDELAALRLVSGYGNKSFEAGERLWRVSAVAAGIPAVRERLHAIEPDTALDTLAALRREPEAAPFIAEMDSYLEEFGWRTGFASPPWIEDPSVPLALIRTHLTSDAYDPTLEQRRLAEDRETALREAMEGLGEQERARLADAHDAAVAVAPQLEDHNYYIDQRLYSMPRRAIVAAAARTGLPTLDDVFYLHDGELLVALRGDRDGVAATAERRKKEFAHWKERKPPPYVGVAPAGGILATSPAPEADAGQGQELRGKGVSPGVVSGPARILTGMHEAARLRPGDVLVTSVTHPAWTPLFTVAGAIVTEVGGMLSHTAIASREYALPAVVAVPDAMRRLKDGQLIEVDGSAGTVRVVG